MPVFESSQEFWFKENLLLQSKKLKAWLINRFPGERDVDDIVQESLMKTFIANERKSLRSPKSFLFTTARNHAINTSKRSRVRGENLLVKIEALDVLDSDSDVLEQIANKQEIEILKGAINSLPEKCRRIVNLRTVEGLTQREIAGELNLSINTVYAQLSIGFHKCAEFVEHHRRNGQK